MKRIKAMLALVALTFGIGGAAAADQDSTALMLANENFDSMTPESKLDTSATETQKWWVPWTAADDDASLTITAYESGAASESTTDASADTQANYLHVETPLNNAVTFSANGRDDKGKAAAYKLADGYDQVYFDSLVNLSIGDGEQMSAVTLPTEARLALWVQEEELQNGSTIGRLCISAGKMSDDEKGNEAFVANVYTTATEVVKGWHRLTVRLFKNAAQTGSEFAALAVYIDETPVQAGEVKPVSGSVLSRLTPKCKALADIDALFPSKYPAGQIMGDVSGVDFAGNGDVDDIVFTLARPSFIDEDSDANYFRLTWDANATSISYTVNNGASTTLDNDALALQVADIKLDSGENIIAVTVGHATTVELDEDNITAANKGGAQSSVSGDVVTFTILENNLTPSSSIVFASNVATATATVKIGEGGTALSATTIAELITAIKEKIDESTGATSGSVYIKLDGDQTFELNDNSSYLELGTAGASGIKWTLDLNGHSITATSSDSVSDAFLIAVLGTLEITDTSENANGSISLGTVLDGNMLIYNAGSLTITKGTFDGRVVFYEAETEEDTSGSGVFNGGKYLIGDDTDSTYLKFLNDNKGEGVTTFAADSENKYYVVSGAEPVETFTVTFVNAKAETQSTEVSVESGKTVSAPDPEPTAENFIFLGWFADGSDTAFDFENTKIESNITLTAKWAAVVAKIGENDYATIQEALDAAVESATADTEVQVDVVANAEVSESLTITGKGSDSTKIAVNVANGVTVSVTATDAGVNVDGATVTLDGEGTWSRTTDGTLFCVGGTSSASLIVKGGTLSVPTTGSYAPVTVKDGSSVNDNTIYILATGTAKFAGPEKLIVGDDAMEDYLAVAAAESGYDYTDDYKFVQGTDGYYTAAAVVFATVTVTWDGNVTNFTATDGSEKYTKPEDVDSLKYIYDVDDKVTFSISKDTITFADDYELDEANSVLTVGPMTDATVAYAIKIVSKAVTPAYEPVDAGSTTDCTDQNAADAMAAAIKADKANLIKTPTDPTTKEAPADFDKAAYVALFDVTVKESDGKYSVVVDLNTEAKETIQGQVDAYGELDLSALATADQNAALSTTPGIYYTVFYGTKPTEITSHGTSVLATKDETTLTYPTLEGGTGFYRVKATVQPISAE